MTDGPSDAALRQAAGIVARILVRLDREAGAPISPEPSVVGGRGERARPVSLAGHPGWGGPHPRTDTGSHPGVGVTA